jgi:hypothetical protein
MNWREIALNVRMNRHEYAFNASTFPIFALPFGIALDPNSYVVAFLMLYFIIWVLVVAVIAGMDQ